VRGLVQKGGPRAARSPGAGSQVCREKRKAVDQADAAAGAAGVLLLPSLAGLGMGGVRRSWLLPVRLVAADGRQHTRACQEGRMMFCSSRRRQQQEGCPQQQLDPDRPFAQLFPGK